MNQIDSTSENKYSQIKFDRNFVKKLLEKLKVGNARSIHLNAIPGRSATRLDLFELSEIDKEIPLKFIETLLNSDSFSFQISYDRVNLGKIGEEEKKRLSLISKRLNNIVIENNDNFLEFGLKNFGFGYPLLIKRDKKDPDKIIKAPLFIWQLDIDRSTQNKNTWTIKKDEDLPIKVNELLISHISRDESIQIEKLPKEFLEDGVLDKTELLSLSKKVLSQLNINEYELEAKIEKCPDSKQIEDIANTKPWIQWSGVFGIYRSQKETIIHATEELLERFEDFVSESLVLEKFQTSTISAIDTDPSQEGIINTLSKNEIKLIQGPPGTGKSQSITAIINNALANNATCLVVCEKKTALDVIQKNLANLNLDDYSILIDDVNKDRKRVIEKARQIKEASGRLFPNYSSWEFNSKYKEFCNLKEDINSKHSESLKKILGDFSWKHLIGLYLKYSKSGDIDTITSSLSYNNLKFNHEEYSIYSALVNEASYLYKDLEENSDSIFADLDTTIFTEKYKWLTHDKLKKDAESIHDALIGLTTFLNRKTQKNFEKNNISIFDPKSLDESENIISELMKSLEEITRLYKRGIKISGDEFNGMDFILSLKFYILSPFSAKSKESVNLRRKISTLLIEVRRLLKNLSKYNLDELKVKKMNEYKSFKEVAEDSSKLLLKMNQIEKKIEELNSIKSQLTKFEKVLAKANKNNYFKYEQKSHLDLGTRDKLYEFYSVQSESIKKILNHLDSYESFHNWEFFRKDKSKFELKLIDCLKGNTPDIWKNIFDAWYFKGVIRNYESKSIIGFHKSDDNLKKLLILYENLKKDQIKQIKSNWNTNRNDKFITLDQNFNTLYNFRKNNAGPKNSLRRIIEADFNLFTALFPVILTNPGVVNAIFPLKKGLFNIVIFDEASQLKISDTFTSLIRGQFKIIAGDEHQMPPSTYFESSGDSLDIDEDEELSSEDEEQEVLAESESLLKYASNTSEEIINKSSLDFHYRSNHPALIEFSNSAFYGGNLVPFPATENYTPIEFRAVNGRYENRTNPDEVAEVLKILRNEVHPDQKNNYPSVGIATFNINQRNLIIEALNEASIKDKLFGKKLQELKDKGLFVKNLENIQGDEKDIIIISTTYGIKPDGSFLQNFARLNRIEGYKLLNVLITRAKHKLYICTSIPKNKYLSYPEIIKAEGNNKRGILYAYLAYAEAISKHKNELSESILKLLKTNSYEKPKILYEDGLSESPFEEEVYGTLLDHFKKEDIIQQHRVGGFRLDFLVKTKLINFILECDGKTFHQSEEAYAHDMFRQKELEKLGYVVYRIWSTNWFQDKEKETKKLLDFIDSKSN